MENFILVSLDADKKVLRESIDLYGLVLKGFEFKSDITSVCESMDVISEHGYRVIVESGTPFIHKPSALTEAGLADLYKKFKEKFGGTKDEFEEWYRTKMEEKKAAEAKSAEKAPEPQIAPSAAGLIEPTKELIRKKFAGDKESYGRLIKELITDFKQNWADAVANTARAQ